MNDELKQLIEDAAKLLGLEGEVETFSGGRSFLTNQYNEIVFNPLDPERGDLMKVAMALFKRGLIIDGEGHFLVLGYEQWDFIEDDHDSLALAILRAASAVWKARGGE